MNHGQERCGTNSGYARHQVLGEKPCDACCRAKSAYDKRWRSAPKRTQQSRLAAKAQSVALQRLRLAHREEYDALYAEEKARRFEEAGLA